MRDCFVVPARVYSDPKYRFDLRRAAFSEAICAATGWDRQSSRRLYGRLISHGVMEFRFADVVQS